MKKYTVEFVGTFFFVLTIGMAVIASNVAPAVALAPIPIGVALMVMIYAGGHISGGHYNPAVTLAAAIRGACPTRDVPGYWIAQCVGAVLAAFTVCYLKGDVAMKAVTPLNQVVAPSLLVEFLFTFALCWVVLHTATAKGTVGNSFYGLAIGFTVLTGAFVVGGISGGAFNPAVALGITVMGVSAWAKIWIFLVANFAAAIAAAIVFKFVNPPET